MGNSSIVRGTISIQVFDYLTSLLFCNERYNACTIVNLQDLQDSLFSVPYTNLLQYITKIHDKNLLFKYCIRRLMVLKEVDFMALYMCVSIVREKYIRYSLFTNVRKVQHCTGCPLVQVEIASVCKSHYMHWLVSQSSCMLSSLLLECVVTLDCLQCGCRYRCRSFCNFCVFFLSF